MIDYSKKAKSSLVIARNEMKDTCLVKTHKVVSHKNKNKTKMQNQSRAQGIKTYVSWAAVFRSLA